MILIKFPLNLFFQGLMASQKLFQLLVSVNPRGVSIAPGEGYTVVAELGHVFEVNVRGDVFRVQQRGARHFIHTVSAAARESQGFVFDFLDFSVRPGNREGCCVFRELRERRFVKATLSDLAVQLVGELSESTRKRFALKVGREVRKIGN